MIIVKPEPHYTEAARRKKLQGSVTLRVVLSAAGKVTNIEVTSGLPDFAGSSIEAAGKIQFIPAMKDGRFVSTAVEPPYNYNIYLKSRPTVRKTNPQNNHDRAGIKNALTRLR